MRSGRRWISYNLLPSDRPVGLWTASGRAYPPIVPKYALIPTGYAIIHSNAVTGNNTKMIRVYQTCSRFLNFSFDSVFIAATTHSDPEVRLHQSNSPARPMRPTCERNRWKDVIFGSGWYPRGHGVPIWTHPTNLKMGPAVV